MKISFFFIIIFFVTKSFSQSFALSYTENGRKNVSQLFYFQKQYFFLVVNYKKLSKHKKYQINASKGCIIKHISKNKFAAFLSEKEIDSTTIYLLSGKKIIDSIVFDNSYYQFTLFINNPNEYRYNVLPDVLGLGCKQALWGEIFQVKNFQLSVYDSSYNIKFREAFASHRISKKSSDSIKKLYDRYDYIVLENIIINGQSKNTYIIPSMVYRLPGFYTKDENLYFRFVKKNMSNYKYSYILNSGESD